MTIRRPRSADVQLSRQNGANCREHILRRLQLHHVFARPGPPPIQRGGKFEFGSHANDCKRFHISLSAKEAWA